MNYNPKLNAYFIQRNILRFKDKTEQKKHLLISTAHFNERLEFTAASKVLIQKSNKKIT